MKVREKLLQEFEAAINAELGDLAEEEAENATIGTGDIDLIANKVKFYLDLQ